MSKKNKKNKCSHQTHGSLVEEENSVLNEVFNIPIRVSATTTKKLEDMSLAELQERAEDLNLVPTDDKKLLLKAIKKELSKR